jgi:non-ribosomal peptide synthase protein (TIGR01720 family)
MGLTPLVFTLDNGFISQGAKDNIKRLVDRLGLELVIGETSAMNDIFVDSLTRFSNVCNGCFKTIYTLSMNIARERGIKVICTGLSRGQIFETRVAHLFQQGCFEADKIDERITDARKAYHRTEDIIATTLDVKIFEDDNIFTDIQYLDYYRYTDVTLDDMYQYLNNIAPWIRPSDTGRSTNCLINDAGIYVHKKERGYHNYALPYSWDVRLGHKEKQAALEELDDEIDLQKVSSILDEIGYEVADVKPHKNQEERLIAYYVAPAEIQKSTLQKHLLESVPKEYVPSQFVWMKTLPINANGKVDRQALPKPNYNLRELMTDYIPPVSKTEEVLVALWSKLLGVKEVGTSDNFFDLGGDSIVNIQIVSAARESGIDISPQQVFDYPTIQQLAKVSGTIEVHKAEQGLVTGEFSLLPVQKRFFENVSLSDVNPNNISHFAQSVTLQYDQDFSTSLLNQAFQKLLVQHDGLRSCFKQTNTGWQQEILPATSLEIIETTINCQSTLNLDQEIEKQRSRLINQLDIHKGQVIGVSNIRNENDNRFYLLIVINKLLIDGVSWWLLLSDLTKCCKQLSLQQDVLLPEKSCSVIQWSEALTAYTDSKDIAVAQQYWTQQFSPQTDSNTLTLGQNNASYRVKLSEQETNQLSHAVPAAFNVQVPDVLLAALVQCKQWFIENSIANVDDQLLVDIEGHGREDIGKGIDAIRTVGCFSSIYPISFTATAPDISQTIRTTKEQLRHVPKRGFDYGVLRYLLDSPNIENDSQNSIAKNLSSQPQANVLFNYLGQWEKTLEADSPFSIVHPISSHLAENSSNSYALEISMMIFDKQLQVNLTYDTQAFSSTAIDTFAKQYKQTLSDFIQHCLQEQGNGLTPSDFPSANIGQDDLEDLFAEFGEE